MAGITSAVSDLDETLKPDGVTEIVDELVEAQNKSFWLGLKLKLPLHEVEAIHKQYSDPQERLLRILIRFTKQVDPKPTWRVIIDALRTPGIGLPALAKRIETAHSTDQPAPSMDIGGVKVGTTREQLRQKLLEKYGIQNSLLDPKHDCDFTMEKDDGAQYFRGGKPYYRPYGWMLFALKVRGKYADDKWLGEPGPRISSSPHEWAVSYYGTKVENCSSILQSGYPTKKQHSPYSRRTVFSTPFIDKAAEYADEFSCEGVMYQFVLQNRINPSLSATGGNAEYYASGKRHIRPYRLCFRVVP